MAHEPSGATRRRSGEARERVFETALTIRASGAWPVTQAELAASAGVGRETVRVLASALNERFPGLVGTLGDKVLAAARRVLADGTGPITAGELAKLAGVSTRVVREMRGAVQRETPGVLMKARGRKPRPRPAPAPRAAATARRRTSAYELALPGGDVATLSLTPRQAKLLDALRSLTARASRADQVLSYERLAAAPLNCSPASLARLRAILVKATGGRATIVEVPGRGARLGLDDPAARATYGPLSLSAATCTAWVRGRALVLTAFEADLLERLVTATAPDRPVPERELGDLAAASAPLGAKLAQHSGWELVIVHERGEVRLLRLAEAPDVEDGLALDPGSGELRRRDRTQRLAADEARVLILLRAHARTLVVRERLRAAAGGVRPCDDRALDELLAGLRVKLLRVSRGRAQLWVLDEGALLAFDALPALLSFGPLAFDRETDTAMLEGTRTTLAPRQAVLVWMLMSLPGGSASKAEIAAPGGAEDDAGLRRLATDASAALRAAFGPEFGVERSRAGRWRLVAPGVSPRHTVDGLEHDRARCEAAYGGRVVRLTPIPSELLAVLASRPGEVFELRALLKRSHRVRRIDRAAVRKNILRLRCQLAPLEGIELQHIRAGDYRLLIPPPAGVGLLVGRFGFDARTGFVWGPDGRIALTPRESAVLAVLLAYAGTAPPACALDVSAGSDLPPSPNVLWKTAHRLRQKLALVAPEDVRLVGKRGSGYIVELVEETWTLGGLAFDRTARTLDVATRRFELDQLESDFLSCLFASPRRPIGLQQLAIRARAHGVDGDAAVVAPLAALSHRLRDSIEQGPVIAADARRRSFVLDPRRAT